MIATKETSTVKTASAVFTSQPGQLQDIHQKEKNIAICQRDIALLQPGIDEVVQYLEENFTASGSSDEIIKQLKKTLSNSKGAKPLIDDIRELLHYFKAITKAGSYRLSLAVVNTNMCRKFHTDINDLRLLCTYSGPGTLWLPDEYVNREALNSCGDNECIITDESKIQQANTGDVVILKGAVYPKSGTKACVHRSPTIEETGETRLLLRIDTNEFINSLS